MEEKERFELTDTDCILDTERNIVISDVCDVITNADIITDLLNQQDKRIKELEEELDDAKRDYIPKLEFGLQRANKMGRDAEKENQQLKQQLATAEKALELACERVKYFEEMQDKEMGFYEFFGYDSDYDLKAIIEQYKQQAKEMLENE